MNSLITATGKAFDCGYFVTIPVPAMAYIRVHNTSVTAVAEVFSSKEETESLTFGNNYYVGYTRLVSITIEDDTILIALAKE